MLNLNKTSTLFALTMLLLSGGVAAQEKKKKATEETVVETAIDTKNFIFKAQTMIPSTGITRQLTSDYDLTVSNDKMISFLPYMGRVFSPVFNPSEGPLTFTSKNFLYSYKAGKKDGWTISIKPRDVRAVREYNLNVTADGYATLIVTGNDRQPITFYGYVIDNNA